MAKQVTASNVGILPKIAPASLVRRGPKPILEESDQTLATLSACGQRQMGVETAAAFLGVSETYLREWFKSHPDARAAFDIAKDQGRAMLLAKQWETAVAGNVQMMIWLGKQWLGQKDQHEIGGGVPIRPTGAKSKLEEAVDRERAESAAEREGARRNAAGDGVPPPRQTH